MQFWAVHLALPIGGVIADRNIFNRFAYSSRRRLLNWLQQVETEICILNKNCMFNWQITIDHHSPRLKSNHGHLSDPPNFSLLSTFNSTIVYRKVSRFQHIGAESAGCQNFGKQDTDLDPFGCKRESIVHLVVHYNFYIPGTAVTIIAAHLQ
jgi:hypothetical protein